MGLARAYQAQKRWEIAAQEWEKVLGAQGEILENEFPPDLLFAHLGLAWAYRTMNDRNRALYESPVSAQDLTKKTLDELASELEKAGKNKMPLGSSKESLVEEIARAATSDFAWSTVIANDAINKGSWSRDVWSALIRAWSSALSPEQWEVVIRILDGAAPVHPEVVHELVSLLIVPQPGNYKLNTYALGMLVRQFANEWGLRRTRCWLNERSPGNAARILARVSDFLPSDGYQLGVDEVFQAYRKSVSRQIAA